METLTTDAKGLIELEDELQIAEQMTAEAEARYKAAYLQVRQAKKENWGFGGNMMAEGSYGKMRGNLDHAYKRLQEVQICLGATALLLDEETMLPAGIWESMESEADEIYGRTDDWREGSS